MWTLQFNTGAKWREANKEVGDVLYGVNNYRWHHDGNTMDVELDREGRILPVDSYDIEFYKVDMGEEALEEFHQKSNQPILRRPSLEEAKKRTHSTSCC